MAISRLFYNGVQLKFINTQEICITLYRECQPGRETARFGHNCTRVDSGAVGEWVKPPHVTVKVKAEPKRLRYALSNWPVATRDTSQSHKRWQAMYAHLVWRSELNLEPLLLSLLLRDYCHQTRGPLLG